VTAARFYAEAAQSAPSLPERDHLVLQAARLNAGLPGGATGPHRSGAPRSG
jgi:hypothetical protein